MLHRMVAAPEDARIQVAEQFGQIGPAGPVSQALNNQACAGGMAQSIADLAPEVCLAVLIDGDVMDIAQVDASFIQAIADCLAWKTAKMLDPAEALLFGGGNQFSITNERGG